MKKRQYELTNRREHVGQIVKLGVIEENLRYIAEQVDAVLKRASAVITSSKSAPGRRRLTKEHLKQRYVMGERGDSLRFTHFLEQITDEPVREVSLNSPIPHTGSDSPRPDHKVHPTYDPRPPSLPPRRQRQQSRRDPDIQSTGALSRQVEGR